jgi:cyclopropane fatty-acyl-phospholipid synthase-like methyltransferase
MSTSSIYEDGTYLTNNPTWHEQDSPWKAEKIDRLLKKNDIYPSTLCEVGCGAGGILSWLSERYANKTMFSGYEISPHAFDICKKKARHNLNYFHKNLLDDNGAVFDVVMAIDVFEHVEDYFGFLRSLREKGTYKVFHIPLDLSVQTVLRSAPIIKLRSSVGHIHYFTKETALATLRDTGYEVVDYFYTNGSELPNRGWKANMLKFPRKLLFSIDQDLAVRVLGGFSLMVLAR